MYYYPENSKMQNNVYGMLPCVKGGKRWFNIYVVSCIHVAYF